MKKHALLALLIVFLVVFFYPKTKKSKCIGFEKREIIQGPLYQDERGTAMEARFEYTCFGMTY